MVAHGAVVVAFGVDHALRGRGRERHGHRPLPVLRRGIEIVVRRGGGPKRGQVAAGSRGEFRFLVDLAIVGDGLRRDPREAQGRQGDRDRLHAHDSSPLWARVGAGGLGPVARRSCSGANFPLPDPPLQ